MFHRKYCINLVESIPRSVADFQTDSNGIQKYILLEINTISKYFLFRMKYFIDGACLV